MIFENLLHIRGHAVWALTLNTNSVVIDAGTHRGEFASSIHSRFGCRCILVEANPSLASKLTPPPGGEVINAALAATDGTAEFIFRDNLEAGGILSQAWDTTNTRCTIPTISLARLMEQAGVPQIDLLKLDIEGAEFTFLDQTSDSSLCSIKQITIEFHDFIPDFRGKRLYEKACARLESLDFLCLPMSFRTHGDVLFLNRSIHRVSPITVFLLKIVGRWALKLRRMWSRARSV
jgi:FkbM family methyltransferase